jgi:hypothetical protein
VRDAVSSRVWHSACFHKRPSDYSVLETQFVLGDNDHSSWPFQCSTAIATPVGTLAFPSNQRLFFLDVLQAICFEIELFHSHWQLKCLTQAMRLKGEFTKSHLLSMPDGF